MNVAALGPWLKPGWEVWDMGIRMCDQGVRFHGVAVRVESHFVSIMKLDGITTLACEISAARPHQVTMAMVLAQLARLDALTPEAYEAQEPA